MNNNNIIDLNKHKEKKLKLQEEETQHFEETSIAVFDYVFEFSIFSAEETIYEIYFSVFTNKKDNNCFIVIEISDYKGNSTILNMEQFMELHYKNVLKYASPLGIKTLEEIIVLHKKHIECS
jgi:hypothetical protein